MKQLEVEGAISELVPHIFKRPLLHVAPTDSLLKVGTFLAIGPQIYVDGLVVLDDRNNHAPIGRIGGQHIIQYIMQNSDGEKWHQMEARQIMSDAPSVVKADSALGIALDIFGTSRFAFVTVALNNRVVTSLSVRDVVRVLADIDRDSVLAGIPVSEISSHSTMIDNHTAISDALKLMLRKGIRNLPVKNIETGRTQVINDRKILEYITSYEGRKMLAGRKAREIGILDMPEATYIKEDLSIKSAAGLFDVRVPCLLLGDNSIVTPWDIVMKGLDLI